MVHLIHIIKFRYAFRSTEKVALQEIGPRFTLKLRSLRKGLPAVKNLGEVAKDLEFDAFEEPEVQNKDAGKVSNAEESMEGAEEQPSDTKKTLPPKEDEYLWVWKVCQIPSSLIFLQRSH